ncbi:MAG: TRAP transporter small permease [Candidatus Methylomirabilales bacterium]
MSDAQGGAAAGGTGAAAPLRVLASLVARPVEWACGLLMTAITVLVFLQVITRYVLEYPLDWPEEAARFLFVWVALLGAVLALRRSAHFSIGALTARFSPAVQRGIAILVHGVLLGFLLLVAWLGLDAALRVREQESAAMEVSMTWGYASVPVGFALLALETARALWRQVRGAAR